MDLQKFNTILDQLRTILPSEPDDNNCVKYCIDAYISTFIKELGEKDELSKEEIEFLLRHKDHKISAVSPLETIINSIRQIREQSHGASQASKVLISSDLYKCMLNQAGVEDTKLCKVWNVNVIESKNVPKDTMIIMCSTRFSFVHSDLMFSVVKVISNPQ